MVLRITGFALFPDLSFRIYMVQRVCSSGSRMYVRSGNSSSACVSPVSVFPTPRAARVPEIRPSLQVAKAVPPHAGGEALQSGDGTKGRLRGA